MRFNVLRARRVVAPAAEPLSKAEARMHLRNPEITSNDAEIDRFIVTAREQAERKTGRALITQTWEYTLDDLNSDDIYEDGGIYLPYAPLQSVTSFSYVDQNGATQVFGAGGYVVDATGIIGRVNLAYGGTWPDARYQANAVTIRYVAGYGAAADVPSSIKNWMLLAIEAMDKNRGLLMENELVLNPIAEALLDPYRIVVF